METINSTLSVLPSTKEQIQIFADKLMNELDNGETDALQLLKVQKAFDKVFDKIKDKLREASIEAAEKYGKGKFGLNGAEYEVKEMGVKYNYEHCGDPKWKRLKEDLKDRETLLKSLKESMAMVDEETGEVITIYPPLKSSTTTVQITL